MNRWTCFVVGLRTVKIQLLSPIDLFLRFDIEHLGVSPKRVSLILWIQRNYKDEGL